MHFIFCLYVGEGWCGCAGFFGSSLSPTRLSGAALVGNGGKGERVGVVAYVPPRDVGCGEGGIWKRY